MKIIKNFDDFTLNEKLNTQFLKKLNKKDLKELTRFLDINKLTDSDFIKITDATSLSKKPYNNSDEYTILILGNITKSKYDYDIKDNIKTTEYKLQYVLQGSDVYVINSRYNEHNRKFLITLINNNPEYDIYAIKKSENRSNFNELRRQRNKNKEGALIDPNFQNKYNTKNNRDNFNFQIKTDNLNRYNKKIIEKSDYDYIIDLFEEKFEKYNRNFNIKTHKLRYSYKDDTEMKNFKRNDNSDITDELKTKIENILKTLKYSYNVEFSRNNIPFFITKLFDYFVDRLSDTSKNVDTKKSIDGVAKILELL